MGDANDEAPLGTACDVTTPQRGQNSSVGWDFLASIVNPYFHKEARPPSGQKLSSSFLHLHFIAVPTRLILSKQPGLTAQCTRQHSIISADKRVESLRAFSGNSKSRFLI